MSFVKRLLDRAIHTRPGTACLRLGLTLTQYRVFSPRTVRMMEFDLLRLDARRHVAATGQQVIPPTDKLHFGCGNRRVKGWLNVDVAGSDALRARLRADRSKRADAGEEPFFDRGPGYARLSGGAAFADVDHL